jgi:GT2 family glycosyltransferase
MIHEPKISIVSPCYNHGLYIPEMLESVFTQSFQSYEVIIVNDGSTDDTKRILDQINHEKVTVIHTPNRGPSAARNVGIAAAMAPIILNLDADDKIAPSLLEKAYGIFTDYPRTGIVNSEVRFFGARTGRFSLPPYSLRAMLEDNVIHSTAFFKKADWAAAGGYSDELIYGLEDYDLWLSIIGLGREIYRIPDELIFYRRYRSPNECRSGRLGINLRRSNNTRLQLFDRHRALYAQEPESYQAMIALRHKIENEHRNSQRLKDLYHGIRSRLRYK